MPGLIPLTAYRAVKKQVTKEMVRLHADDTSIKKAVSKAFRLLRSGHDLFYAIKIATREHAFDFLGMPNGPGAV